MTGQEVTKDAEALLFTLSVLVGFIADELGMSRLAVLEISLATERERSK